MTTNHDKRADLLKALRTHGVTQVTAEYCGYSDSGEIQDFSAVCGETPANLPKIAGLTTNGLYDLFWNIIASKHSGFENNEGGDGTVTWDVTRDQISLVHNENHLETETYQYEGL